MSRDEFKILCFFFNQSLVQLVMWKRNGFQPVIGQIQNIPNSHWSIPTSEAVLVMAQIKSKLIWKFSPCPWTHLDGYWINLQLSFPHQTTFQKLYLMLYWSWITLTLDVSLIKFPFLQFKMQQSYNSLKAEIASIETKYLQQRRHNTFYSEQCYFIIIKHAQFVTQMTIRKS